MAIPVDAWLDVMERECLGEFIPRGGAAVRFAVAEAVVLDRVADGLRDRAAACGLECVVTPRRCGWITQWGVLRLQGRATMLELGTVPPNYRETHDFNEPPAVMDSDPLP